MMNELPASQLTAILAARDNCETLESCLKALRWVPHILIVQSKPDPFIEDLGKKFGANVIHKPSLEPAKLWEAGLEQVQTPWVLLLQSNEIVTGQLRKTILEKIESEENRSCFFPLPLTTVFLRRRFKYRQRWFGFHPSCLVFIPTTGKLTFLKSIAEKKHQFQGELIHYGEKTLKDCLNRTNSLAEIYADQLFEQHPDLSRFEAFYKAVCSTLQIGFSTFVVKKGFKEGFEGAAFAFFDALAKLLGFLRYHEKYIRDGGEIPGGSQGLKNILLIKLRDIGDNILCTPLIRNLKRSLPQAAVSILTYSYSLSVFENNPHVEKLYGVAKNPTPKELNDLKENLKNCRFDLALNTHGGRLSSNIAESIDARFWADNHYVGRNKEGKFMIEESDHYRSAIERDLDCLRSLGIEPADSQTEIFLKDDEISWAKKQLEEHGFDPEKKTVVIHPTAAAEIREWEIDRFGRLLQMLKTHHETQTLVICTDEEYSKVSKLYEYDPEVVVFHQMTVRQMMAVIHESDLVIDNDSSPSHVATAFKIPTIVLFSQAIREIFRPYDEAGDKHYVFYKDVDCRECGLTYCDNRICLDFTPEEVYSKSLEMLSASR